MKGPDSSTQTEVPLIPASSSPGLLGRIKEEQLFFVLAIFIGIAAGIAVVLFRIALDWSRLKLLGSGLQPSAMRVLIAPAAVGLVVAFLVMRFFPAVRGSGVNQTKAAVYIYDGYIPFRTVVGKFLTAALAIGGGHSLGPEDPSLQVGAGLASAVGQRLKLSRERVRLIAPLGAAAGLAAAFNSPIAAVLFVIEEVIGNWSANVLGAVVLSAVSGTVVARWFLGSEALFRIPSFSLQDPAELLAYAALGLVGGFISLIFVKLVLFLRPRLKAMPRWTQYFQPAIAGLLIGIIALQVPEILGAGYEAIDQAMHGQFTWQFLLVLLAFKIIATVLSFVAGTPGGLFAPTLFIGAMLGGAVGGLEHVLFPHFGASVGAYALIGMGVMFAGILRAPMTSVFMVLEVSGNYAVILPVMIANTIAYLISRGLQPTPIFEMLSRQDGLDLPSMEAQREEVVLRVEDAMRPLDLPVADVTDSIGKVRQQLRGSDHPFILISDRPADAWYLLGAPVLFDSTDALDEQLSMRNVLPPERTPHLHPDHPLELAMRYAAVWPVVPVVHRANYQQVLGLIQLEDILQTYRRFNRVVPEEAKPEVPLKA